MESITVNEDDNTLTIKWWTGGNEGAVCGLVLKVDVESKIISNYKSPEIDYDPDYDEPF